MSAGADAEGAIERDGAFVVFRYVRPLARPVPQVWAAITEPDRIARWFGSRPEIDAQPGGAYVVEHGNGMRVEDRVLRVEPPTLFEHTFWAQLNPDATVTWELAEDGTAVDGAAEAGDAARLTLTHRLSDADIDNALATVAAGDDRGAVIARNAAGWRRLLDRLEAALD